MTIRCFVCDNGHLFEAVESWMVSKWDCPVCGNEEHWRDISRELEKKKASEMLLCKPDHKISLDVEEVVV